MGGAGGQPGRTGRKAIPMRSTHQAHARPTSQRHCSTATSLDNSSSSSGSFGDTPRPPQRLYISRPPPCLRWYHTITRLEVDCGEERHGVHHLRESPGLSQYICQFLRITLMHCRSADVTASPVREYAMEGPRRECRGDILLAGCISDQRSVGHSVASVQSKSVSAGVLCPPPLSITYQHTGTSQTS